MRLLAAALLPSALLLAHHVRGLGEVIGILLPAIGIAATLMGILVRRNAAAAVACAATGLAAIASTLTPLLPVPMPAPAVDITIVSANLTGSSAGDEAAVALAAEHPDVLVTVETPALALQVLSEAYPHHMAALPRALGGVVVWSAHPLRRLPLLDGTRQARTLVVEVGTPQPFTLVAAHLPRPWATSDGLLGGRRRGAGYQASLPDQQRIAAAMARGVAAIAGPVVLAGDLNASDRGWAYGELTTDLRDVMRSTWAAPTSVKPLFLPLLLRIDHILVGGGICGGSDGLRDIEGSDHRAVAARIGPCATGPAATPAG